MNDPNVERRESERLGDRALVAEMMTPKVVGFLGAVRGSDRCATDCRAVCLPPTFDSSLCIRTT